MPPHLYPVRLALPLRAKLAPLLLALILIVPTTGSAFPAFRNNFFAAYPGAVGTTIETLTTSTRTNHCGVCHYNFSGGGPRNPYGQAVEATNRSTASILALGPLDSDGDGFTNDQEIMELLFGNTPTFPGLVDEELALVSNVDPLEIEDFLRPETVHNELFDGDLADDRLAPDAFALEEGENVLLALQQGDAFGRDIDYFTLNVPAGLEITGLTVVGFDAEPGNLAFLGVQPGTTFSVDAGAAQASDLLGGAVFGATDIGLDLLPDIGTLPGATGFTPPLPAGDYTIWLNQTGPPSTATLSVVVPEPAAGGLLAAGVLGLVGLGRRGEARRAPTGRADRGCL